MKLSNNVRDAFVRAAMQDVPKIDYAEKIRALAYRAAVDELPPAVRKVWDNPATNAFIGKAYATYGYAKLSTSISVTIPTNVTMPETAVAEIGALVDAAAEQAKRMEGLERQLRGAALACGTRKQLAEMLPEFEKYLPADEAAALRTVPVIANIAAEFAAAGWPAGKKQAK